ncbi:unnamed protein product [Aphanomyces euteiches]|uniref:Uncharacterized protein n=1 Tax=Aphanomyces euteiches TaxID=100861 RepID=A0A6G0XWL7_9STRA|nr:hypothetical protein Ae201684_000682 [Aphanomyces euteiches]KAH9091808.1 hypothetical protein Ae201684P_011352 [Aphanomyces euteiches]KAH9157135.1 hypothetical protein AeRB84_001008 [Aphanomyces euteiches]
MHQRHKSSVEDKLPASSSEEERRKSRHVSLLFVVLWLASLVGFAFWRHLWLPTPKGLDAPRTEFSEARARVFLEELQSIDGFRTVGSVSNEIETPRWLLNHLETLENACVDPCQMEIDIQRPTGAFGLNFLSQFQNVYANVSNILVRVQRTNHTETTPALLLSSHYDAAVGAGAASDDGVNIAIMLEILQNTIAGQLPLHHALVFNFNGAEETMLQAAHGFITQHPWKKQVAAFINLEATGAGGRELLFQTGSDILAMAYAKGAPYPHASTIAQEVFQSGVVPGITDYEVYESHGDVAGMDFAYVANGYVYHTQLDDISRIQQGAVQRFGDNIQGTMRVLLADPDTLASISSESQRHIFFDVFGFATLTYTENVGGWINYMVVVLAAVYCGIWSPLTLRQRFSGLFQLIKMSAAAFLAPLPVALVLAHTAPLSWFASPATRLWVFVCPSAVAFLTFFPTKANMARMTQSFLEGLTLLWMLLSAALMCFGIQSVYLCIIWVFFPLLSFVVAEGFKGTSIYTTLGPLSLLVGPALPFAYFVSVYIIVLQVFIPIMGRMGNTVYADVIVAALTALPTSITLSNFAPILCRVQPAALHASRKLLVVGTLAALAVAFVSNPYSADTPKRLGITHVYRNFSTLDIPDDWGLWMHAYDFSRLEPLRPIFEQTKWRHQLKPPTDGVSPIEIYGNFPWLYPIFHILPIRYSWYLPASVPDVHTIPTYIDIVSTTFDEATNRRKIHLFFTGPPHMSLYIDAKSTKLTAWSLGQGANDGVPPQVEETYIIQLASGSPVSSFHFWLEAESNSTMVAAYCGYYLEALSADLKAVIDVLPEWASYSSGVASWGILRV